MKSFFEMNFNLIKLNKEAILNIPFKTYDEFSFIVNDKIFKTTKIVAELISPIICRYHQCDPTINNFTITTKEEGDFNIILKLINFEEQTFPESQLPFISEVVEILGNDSIECKRNQPNLTKSNALKLLNEHLKFKIFYSESIQNEINFISSHLYEIIEEQENELNQLSIDALMLILNNENISLLKEDQLVNFINHLYFSDSKYSKLYDFVLFENVGTKAIDEFLNIYDINDMTNEIWAAISRRLQNNKNCYSEIKKSNSFRYNTNVLIHYFLITF